MGQYLSSLGTGWCQVKQHTLNLSSHYRRIRLVWTGAVYPGSVWGKRFPNLVKYRDWPDLFHSSLISSNYLDKNWRRAVKHTWLNAVTLLEIKWRKCCKFVTKLQQQHYYAAASWKYARCRCSDGWDNRNNCLLSFVKLGKIFKSCSVTQVVASIPWHKVVLIYYSIWLIKANDWDPLHRVFI